MARPPCVDEGVFEGLFERAAGDSVVFRRRQRRLLTGGSFQH
jgi:hypothetical protein